jgi:hypothetical protein
MGYYEKPVDSEQELRWRAWEEKGRRADRRADKWMKILFSAVGLILLAWVVYEVFVAKATGNHNQVQRAIRCNHISIPVA